MTQEYRCGWDSIKRKAPGWFRDAKFGLFFHWGPYSVPAYKDEWYSGICTPRDCPTIFITRKLTEI